MSVYDAYKKLKGQNDGESVYDAYQKAKQIQSSKVDTTFNIPIPRTPESIGLKSVQQQYKSTEGVLPESVKPIVKTAMKYNPIFGGAQRLIAEGISKVAPSIGDPIQAFQSEVQDVLGVNKFLVGQTSDEKRIEGQNPIASGIGNFVGYIAPGVGLEKIATKALPKLAIGAGEKIIPKIAKSAATNALVGGTMGATEGALNEAGRDIGLSDLVTGNDKRDVLGKALEGGLWGAGLGGLIGGAATGIGSGIKNAIAKKALNKIDEGYNKYKTEGIFGVKTSQPAIKSSTTPIKTIGNINSHLQENTPLKTQNTASNFDNIKTVDDLPNDIESLKKFVEYGRKNKYLRINLQLFSEAEKKLSQFYFNTIKRANEIPDHIKEQIDPKDFEYVAQKVSEWDNSAKNNVMMNRTGVERDIRDAVSIDGGIKGHESAEIMRQLIDEGDPSKVIDWLKVVSSKGRESARGLKSLDSAFPKNSKEYQLLKIQRNVDNATNNQLKSNPKIKNQYDSDLNKATKTVKEIRKAEDKTIDEVTKNMETSFPEMLKNRISNALNPKTPEELGFIRTMLKDLFGEARENIPMPKVARPDNSIKTVADAYKYRQYAGEIRQKAQELLKQEFKEDPETLKVLDNYFNKGFRPPHSQKLLNNIISKRLTGINQTISNSTGNQKQNLAEWVKDWYATGRAKREDFITSLVNETGLTGDEANSFRNTLESKMHVATKQMKDRLLNQVFAEPKNGIVKTATQKLGELTNIGMFENQKFTGKISEKLSPVIKQLMRENGVNLNDVVKLSLQDKNNAKAALLRDVVRNARVDDREIVKLVDIVNREFNTLAKQKQTSILNNMAKERTSPTQRTMIERLREKINLGLYGDDIDSVIQDAVKEKYNLPTLSPDEVTFITETMDSVKGLSERSEKYLEAMAKVEKLILEKTPASLTDKVSSGGFISMLFNPASQITNIGGNTLIAAPEIASNPLRRGFDKLLSVKTGFRTVGKTDFGSLASGAKQGVRQVKRDMLGGRDFKDLKGKSINEIYDILANPINTDATNTNFGDKFETGKRLAFDNRFGRTLENLTGTGMKIGDLPFNQAYFEDALQGIMKANRVNEPTEDMLKTAFQVSQERTYKDKNLLSSGAVALKNLPNMVLRNLGIKPEALRGANKLVEIPQILFNSQIPFAKTPANLVKRGTEYSPLGLVEGVGKLLANKNNMSMIKQREIVDRLTRGTVGTGALGLGALGYKYGLVTDARDENPTVEKFKQDSKGILPDALKAGNRTYDLKKLQPATTPIIAGSRLKQGKGEGVLSTTLDALAGAANMYTDMPMLQNLARASQLFASSDSANPPDKSKIILDILTSIPKQFVPAVVKKIAYSTDDYERNLKDSNALQYSANQIFGKLPGVSNKFPVKTDLLGNPIKSYDGNNNLGNTLFNPYITSKIKNNPFADEALRLNKTVQDSDLKNGVIPKEPPKNIEGYNLTERQRNTFQKLFGDKAQVKIDNLINSYEYESLDDNDKALAFGKALELAKEEAKNEMLADLGFDTEENKTLKRDEQRRKTELLKSVGLGRIR